MRNHNNKKCIYFNMSLSFQFYKCFFLIYLNLIYSQKCEHWKKKNFFNTFFKKNVELNFDDSLSLLKFF